MAFRALVSVALGILSIMILFSLAATALQEVISQLLNTRGRRLRDGIIVLLETNLPENLRTENAFELFYEKFYESAKLSALTTAAPPNKLLRLWDGLKTGLRGGRRKLPSGIEPRRYAEAMLDLIGNSEQRNKRALEAKAVVDAGEALLVNKLCIAGEALDTKVFTETAAEVEKVSGEIQTRIDRAQSFVDARIRALEDEFNQTMDRVSGWYARQVKLTLFLIGLCLAAGANIDLIGYAQRMLADENLRNKAEVYAKLLATSNGVLPVQGDEGSGDAQAEQPGPPPDSTVSPANLGEIIGELEKLEVRIGWCAAVPARVGSADSPMSDTPVDDNSILGLCPEGQDLNWPPTVFQVIGWFLIAFGVTLGSQFWFNLFKSLLKLRTSGRLRETTAAGSK